MTKELMFARTVLSSAHADGGPPLRTLHLRYPRVIHAEAKTHRLFEMDSGVIEAVTASVDLMADQVLNRNARSSRAVPFKTMVEEIKTAPFVPWHWTRNQRGMQGVESYDADEIAGLEELWLEGRDAAVAHAEAMVRLYDPHKQVVNRLLEPYGWIDVLVTATDWANFLHLRDHPDAEPHIHDLAVLVREEVEKPTGQILEPGEWHLPYITEDDWHQAARWPWSQDGIGFLRKVSAARCARISYQPFDGDPSYERELQRYEQLVGGGAVHATPLEHQATPDTRGHYEVTRIEAGKEELIESGLGWDHPKEHGSLTGWRQFRKMVPNEAVHG